MLYVCWTLFQFDLIMYHMQVSYGIHHHNVVMGYAWNCWVHKKDLGNAKTTIYWVTGYLPKDMLQAVIIYVQVNLYKDDALHHLQDLCLSSMVLTEVISFNKHNVRHAG